MFRLILLAALAAPLFAHAQAYPSKADFLGGQVNLMFDNLPTALPHVKSGKLKALAASSAKKSARAPDLPTMAESGLAGFDLATWFAFFAPAATPRERPPAKRP